MEQHFNQNNIETNQQEKEISFKSILVFLSVLFFPTMLVGVLFYYIFFRTLMWKPIMTGLLTLIIVFLFFLLGIFVVNFSTLNNIIFSYFYICIALGFITGFIIILVQAYRLKKYPEISAFTGWTQNFKYKKTIFEKIAEDKLKKGLEEGEYHSYDMAPIGILEDKVQLRDEQVIEKKHIVGRYYSEALKGTLVFGATGSGKSIAFLSLMYNDILAGYPICAIDFKKGPDVAYFLSKWAKENNRKFYHFLSGPAGHYKNPYCEHQASYDPLSVGTSTSKADMMLNLRKWDNSSDVYKGRTQSILQSIFYLLERVDRNALPKMPWNEGGLSQFVAALQTANLFDMISWLREDIEINGGSMGDRKRLQELLAFYNELVQNTKSVLREQMDGLAIICRTLIMSSYSDWLAKGETPNHINLLEIATDKTAPIVLFQFNPNEEAEFAQYMGNIILSDLLRVSSYKYAKGDKNYFGVYFDEAQSLDPMRIAGIMEKARASQFFTTLSYQSLEQISKSSPQNGEEVLKSMLDTVSNFIILNGSTLDTGLKYSKLIGMTKKTVYKTTGKFKNSIFSNNRQQRKDAMINKSIEDVYIVEPSDFQKLSSPIQENNYKSTGYYITKECSEPICSNLSQVIARKIQIIPNKSVLEKVPDDFAKNLLDNSYARRYNVKPVSSRSKQQDTLDDGIFKITEETQENVKLDALSAELAKEQMLSQKEYAKVNKRDDLEPPKKQVSWDKFTKKKSKKTDINNEFTMPKID